MNYEVIVVLVNFYFIYFDWINILRKINGCLGFIMIIFFCCDEIYLNKFFKIVVVV